MLLKSQELNIKRKDFFKGKVVLLYGENHDLIKDLNEEILNKLLWILTIQFSNSINIQKKYLSHQYKFIKGIYRV